MRDIRGQDIAMVFQDPMSSLNPVVPIGIQVTEVLERHRGMQGRGGRDRGASTCSRGSASPTRTAGSRSTRTSSPAACASAR